MKKNYFKVLGALCAFFAFNLSVSAQQTAPDITWTDLNGKEHRLYDYLDAGKTVIVDFFAVWCGPCWNYHQGHALDQLYKQYGPNGTDELMVLAVESDHNTPASTIRGGGNSIGNWTTGVSYPICDATQQQVYTMYVEAFPTILMFCPDRSYKNIGQPSAAQAYSQAGQCAGPPAPTANFNTDHGKVNTPIKFNNLTDIRSSVTYKWTFDSGSPATSTDEFPTVTWSAPGTYSVTLETTGIGGKTDVTKDVIVIEEADYGKFVLDFEDMADFSNDYGTWKTVDEDDTYNTFFSNAVLNYPGKTNTDNGFIAFNGSSNQQTSQEAWRVAPAQGDKCGFSLSNSDGETKDWLISPKLQLGEQSLMSFYIRVWVTPKNQKFYNATVEVYVSETDDELASFTYLGKLDLGYYNQAWYKIDVDLAAYDNKEVHIALKNATQMAADGNDGGGMFLDDIFVGSKIPYVSTVGIEDNTANKLEVFPNPTSGVVQVNNTENGFLTIYDITGKEIESVQVFEHNLTLDLNHLSKGCYILKFTSESGVKQTNLIVE